MLDLLQNLGGAVLDLLQNLGKACSKTWAGPELGRGRSGPGRGLLQNLGGVVLDLGGACSRKNLGGDSLDLL